MIFYQVLKAGGVDPRLIDGSGDPGPSRHWVGAWLNLDSEFKYLDRFPNCTSAAGSPLYYGRAGMTVAFMANEAGECMAVNSLSKTVVALVGKSNRVDNVFLQLSGTKLSFQLE